MRALNAGTVATIVLFAFVVCVVAAKAELVPRKRIRIVPTKPSAESTCYRRPALYLLHLA